MSRTILKVFSNIDRYTDITINNATKQKLTFLNGYFIHDQNTKVLMEVDLIKQYLF